MDIDKTWAEIKNGVLFISENKFEPVKNVNRKEWVTNKIIELNDDSERPIH